MPTESWDAITFRNLRVDVLGGNGQHPLQSCRSKTKARPKLSSNIPVHEPNIVSSDINLSPSLHPADFMASAACRPERRSGPKVPGSEPYGRDSTQSAGRNSQARQRDAVPTKLASRRPTRLRHTPLRWVRTRAPLLQNQAQYGSPCPACCITMKSHPPETPSRPITSFPPGALVRTSDICRDPRRGYAGILPIDRSTWHRWVKSGKAPAGRCLAGTSTRVWEIEVVRSLGTMQ